MKWHRAYKTVINTLKNKDDLQFITIRQNISILFKMLLLFNSGCFCYDCFHSIFNQGDYSAKEDKLYLKQNVSNFFFQIHGGSGKHNNTCLNLRLHTTLLLLPIKHDIQKSSHPLVRKNCIGVSLSFTNNLMLSSQSTPRSQSRIIMCCGERQQELNQRV